MPYRTKKRHNGKSRDVYNCEICNNSFSNGNLLHHHLRTSKCAGSGSLLHISQFSSSRDVVPAATYICGNCHLKFSDAQSLELHLVSRVCTPSRPQEDNEDQFTCGMCQQNFVSAVELGTHIETKHSCISAGQTLDITLQGLPEEFVCGKCQSVFESASSLEYHVISQTCLCSLTSSDKGNNQLNQLKHLPHTYLSDVAKSESAIQLLEIDSKNNQISFGDSNESKSDLSSKLNVENDEQPCRKRKQNPLSESVHENNNVWPTAYKRPRLEKTHNGMEQDACDTQQKKESHIGSSNIPINLQPSSVGEANLDSTSRLKICPQQEPGNLFPNQCSEVSQNKPQPSLSTHQSSAINLPEGKGEWPVSTLGSSEKNLVPAVNRQQTLSACAIDETQIAVPSTINCVDSNILLDSEVYLEKPDNIMSERSPSSSTTTLQQDAASPASSTIQPEAIVTTKYNSSSITDLSQSLPDSMSKIAAVCPYCKKQGVMVRDTYVCTTCKLKFSNYFCEVCSQSGFSTTIALLAHMKLHLKHKQEGPVKIEEGTKFNSNENVSGKCMEPENVKVDRIKRGPFQKTSANEENNYISEQSSSETTDTEIDDYLNTEIIKKLQDQNKSSVMIQEKDIPCLPESVFIGEDSSPSVSAVGTLEDVRQIANETVGSVSVSIETDISESESEFSDSSGFEEISLDEIDLQDICGSDQSKTEMKRSNAESNGSDTLEINSQTESCDEGKNVPHAKAKLIASSGGKNFNRHFKTGKKQAYREQKKLESKAVITILESDEASSDSSFSQDSSDNTCSQDSSDITYSPDESDTDVENTENSRNMKDIRRKSSRIQKMTVDRICEEEKSQHLLSSSKEARDYRARRRRLWEKREERRELRQRSESVTAQQTDSCKVSSEENISKYSSGIKSKNSNGYQSKNPSSCQSKISSDHQSKKSRGHQNQDTSGYQNKKSSGYQTKDSSGYQTKDSSGIQNKDSSGIQNKDSSGIQNKDSSGIQNKDSSGIQNKDSSGYQGKHSSGLQDENFSAYQKKDSRSHQNKESRGHQDENSSAYQNKVSRSHQNKESRGHQNKNSSAYQNNDSHGHQNKESHGHHNKKSSAYQNKDSRGHLNKGAERESVCYETISVDSPEKNYSILPKTFKIKESIRSDDSVESVDYVCGECNVHYTTLSTLRDHLKTHCEHLDDQTEDLESKSGASSANSNSTFPIKDKQKDREVSDSLVADENVSETKDQYVCGMCQLQTNTAEDLAAHMQSHIRTFQFECNQCETVWPSLSSLTQHMHEHQKLEEEFVCGECSVSFTSMSYLEVHMKFHALIGKSGGSLLSNTDPNPAPIKATVDKTPCERTKQDELKDLHKMPADSTQETEISNNNLKKDIPKKKLSPTVSKLLRYKPPTALFE